MRFLGEREQVWKCRVVLSVCAIKRMCGRVRLFFSTSTRNFPNRMGKNTQVFLGSAEWAAVCAKLGYIPTLEECRQHINCLQNQIGHIYRSMQFDQVPAYQLTNSRK